jgi:hypothetical protein
LFKLLCDEILNFDIALEVFYGLFYSSLTSQNKNQYLIHFWICPAGVVINFAMFVDRIGSRRIMNVKFDKNVYDRFNNMIVVV